MTRSTNSRSKPVRGHIRYTLDTYKTPCRCGGSAYLQRRGPVALLPTTHRAPDGGPCPALDAQEDEVRTHNALATIGEGHTPTELGRRLRHARSA